MRIALSLIVFTFWVGSNNITAQSIWDINHLEKVKKSLGIARYNQSYGALIAEADKTLSLKPPSVVDKEKIPASGTKHDYMSQARYYWPNLYTPDGLPYISRDGESNPELQKLDRNRLGTLANSVITLSLAWYFSEDEKYAKKATELIKTWFFNDATKMNPNLNYAQVIPGFNNNKGRCYGVIDTYSFVEMLDAVQLLEFSKAFTKTDSKNLKDWFKELLDWILTSEQGVEESKQENNHSISYDAQVISFSLYVGREDIARLYLKNFPEKRLFMQIEPDGSQPHELHRTLGFGYSQFNIQHMIDVFLMGEKIGVSISDTTSIDGRNFYKAIDFLIPYMGKSIEQWPYQQISGWEDKQEMLSKDIYRAYILNPSRIDYANLFNRLQLVNVKDRFNLLYIKMQ